MWGRKWELGALGEDDCLVMRHGLFVLVEFKIGSGQPVNFSRYRFCPPLITHSLPQDNLKINILETRPVGALYHQQYVLMIPMV